MDALSYIGAGILALFAFTGALPWLRYGAAGVHFIWSRDFAEALRKWQIDKATNREIIPGVRLHDSTFD